jgi:cbb3-type cytochrome oxidase maturation protein
MSVVIFLIILGILVAGGFLVGFIWAVKTGQYDDTESPAIRMLFDESKPVKKKIKGVGRQKACPNGT